jgi:hypothetical protein
MHSVFAWPVRLFSPSAASSLVYNPDRSLTLSSHPLISHHGVNTTFLEFRWVINYCQFVACLTFSLNLATARSYIFYCIFSRRTVSSFYNYIHLICSFSPLYLNTTRTYWFSISLGPNSILIGTPFNSQWLNFHPGL